MTDKGLFSEDNYTAWVEVILPLAIPVAYTYAIPANLLQKAKAGCRAEVSFKTNKKYAGIIRNVHTTKPVFPVKPLLNILDDEPIMYPQQLKFWKWLSEYYMCTEGEVMIAALPANLKLSSETVLLYNDAAGDDFSNLNDEQYIVAEALLLKKQLKLSEVQQLLDVTHVYPVIKKLVDEHICFVWEELNERYRVKTEKYVELHANYSTDEALSVLLNDWKGAPKQMELLLSFIHLYKKEGEVSQPALLKKSGATAAQLKALAEKGIVTISKRSIDRIRQLPKKVDIDFELTKPQQEAFNNIKTEFEAKSVGLLHGVTSSGKTQIYIRLIESYFLQGKQVLYLLPEIALTAQIIRRLQKHFGGNIAIYHSKFNQQERIELWNKVRTGEVRILVGARSSLFLPFNNLGLIIVDEEHDASFKQQDPAPRYNARDSAIFYASIFQAKVLLGTATPSMESYFNAMQGKYFYVSLTERFGGTGMPDINIINTTKIAGKGKVMLSPQMTDAIEKELEKGKQVILFQNRRGYNPYLICGTCGHIPQCQHCDVSLTMHKYSNKLHCHYCGSTYPRLVSCTRCGTVNWMEKNFGTEKIEEQLESDFSKYKIARMDVDSVKGKDAHNNLIQSFEQKRIDILVGTQMVVKGLDFENVSLVGILDADGLLSFADFRVHERAFQLMEQVSGRAGRREEKGKVLIQAIDVKHPVLDFVKQHDFALFYTYEIANRKQFYYPPFSRIVRITLKHKDQQKVKDAAAFLGTQLSQDFQQYMAGPAAPVIPRLRNQYLQEIMIKLPREGDKPSIYKKVISHHINLMHSNPPFKAVVVVADVDPM